MVRPIDAQISLMKLDEILQHVRHPQAQAQVNTEDRTEDTKRVKDEYLSSVTKSERAEQDTIVREREEEKNKSRRESGREKPPRKRIDIVT